MWIRTTFVLVLIITLQGCIEEPDFRLRQLIREHGLTGDPAAGRDLPAIDEPLAQLGKKLFFTKALGGNFDSACVSCHHPLFGGSDGLSLPVGVGAIDPDLIGPGRESVDGLPNVPRNAPTTFNIGLWDAALFMDSRVASLGAEPGQNGAASGIATPDSGPGIADDRAGANLVVAQARFPVTSVEEMRGNLASGGDNATLRAHLAARIGDYGRAAGELGDNRWLQEFRSAFGSSEPAAALITFDNIALAIAEYERSQLFVDNPWRAYVEGDLEAISTAAKEGAVLFLTSAAEGGAGCVQCHSGDNFSDESHHAIGAPQFGPGKGNGTDGSGDFGRENVSGDPAERYRFRTPSLLNVSVSAPYTHAGAYETLLDVIDHHVDPHEKVAQFFSAGAWCQLDQFASVPDCHDAYDEAARNTAAALVKVARERKLGGPAALPEVSLTGTQRKQIVAFLLTLTDPCVTERECLSPWIADPSEAADSHQLNAVDFQGNVL